MNAEDPEEQGEFSHETYKNKVGGRYNKTKGKIREIEKMLAASNLKFKDRRPDVSMLLKTPDEDGSTEELTKRSGSNEDLKKTHKAIYSELVSINASNSVKSRPDSPNIQRMPTPKFKSPAPPSKIEIREVPVKHSTLKRSNNIKKDTKKVIIKKDEITL